MFAQLVTYTTSNLELTADVCKTLNIKDLSIIISQRFLYISCNMKVFTSGLQDKNVWF